MYYVDSHIHLQDYKSLDIKNVINRAQKNNVCRFVNVSAHPSDWDQVKKIADDYVEVIPAFGVHPWYLSQAPEDWYENLENILRKVPEAWVGECGIDLIKNPDISTQLEALKMHADLAVRYNRPLIVHAVKAEAILPTLFDMLPARTIFHSYTGSIALGSTLQKHGFYVGLNFSILRKKNYAEILHRLNLDYCFLETDGPYQSGMKDTESMPENLPQLASVLASEKNISLAQITQILYQNWQKFTGE